MAYKISLKQIPNYVVEDFKCYSLYSNISPGWQSSALQIDSRVSNLTPFAFPFFKIDKFTVVSPTRWDSSLSETFRLAIMTSKLMMIAIIIQLLRFHF